jgi:hypothetical protein
MPATISTQLTCVSIALVDTCTSGRVVSPQLSVGLRLGSSNMISDSGVKPGMSELIQVCFRRSVR